MGTVAPCTRTPPAARTRSPGIAGGRNRGPARRNPGSGGTRVPRTLGSPCPNRCACGRRPADPTGGRARPRARRSVRAHGAASATAAAAPPRPGSARTPAPAAGGPAHGCPGRFGCPGRRPLQDMLPCPGISRHVHGCFTKRLVCDRRNGLPVLRQRRLRVRAGRSAYSPLPRKPSGRALSCANSGCPTSVSS